MPAPSMSDCRHCPGRNGSGSNELKTGFNRIYFEGVGVVGVGQDGERHFPETVQGQHDAANENEEDQGEDGAHVTSQHHAYWSTPNHIFRHLQFPGSLIVKLPINVASQLMPPMA